MVRRSSRLMAAAAASKDATEQQTPLAPASASRLNQNPKPAANPRKRGKTSVDLTAQSSSAAAVKRRRVTAVDDNDNDDDDDDNDNDDNDDDGDYNDDYSNGQSENISDLDVEDNLSSLSISDADLESGRSEEEFAVKEPSSEAPLNSLTSRNGTPKKTQKAKSKPPKIPIQDWRTYMHPYMPGTLSEEFAIRSFYTTRFPRYVCDPKLNFTTHSCVQISEDKHGRRLPYSQSKLTDSDIEYIRYRQVFVDRAIYPSGAVMLAANFNKTVLNNSDSSVRFIDLCDIDKRSYLQRFHHSLKNSFPARYEATMSGLWRNHTHVFWAWTELAKSSKIEPVAIKQPAMISRRLKKFQLEGVDWMIKQEKSMFKGGLLGDEMGMGKTIQAVSLMTSDYPAPAPTLVLVPPVALLQWENEMRQYTDGRLKVLVHHQSTTKGKKLTLEQIRQYDVILVSYNTLESLYRKQVSGWKRGENVVKEDSPFHAIDWHRIILDEAHSIKQRTTGVAKACFALKGTYRWCLSGTPVQNRIGEFFSLLRFLRVRPSSDYMCLNCKCEAINWELDAKHKCIQCGCAGSRHLSYFNWELLTPLVSSDKNVRRLALDKLQMLTSRVMLRRQKRDHSSSMELPAKSVVVSRQLFGEIERDFSKSIMQNSSRTFDTYVSRGVMLDNYANIFGLIMQMRQVANHPDLILRNKTFWSEGAAGQSVVLMCCVCHEPAEDPVRAQCKHEFCRSCVREYVMNAERIGRAECPQCRATLTVDWEQEPIDQAEGAVAGAGSIVNRIEADKWTSSTKIEQLVYELYKLRSRKGSTKSIVFSQFTSMLQLVQWRLHRAGFKTVMLDGGMNPVQRQRAIEYFMSNVDVEVFLVSLKAGGVALNLTEASQVFIVDPWWNPAAEWQSADRCHRIGQGRPCQITRLCIEDSVESRIVQLQEKKTRMIECAVNNDDDAITALTPEDLQFLFRGS